eukprot:6454681-Amphidinium_carterae.1
MWARVYQQSKAREWSTIALGPVMVSPPPGPPVRPSAGCGSTPPFLAGSPLGQVPVARVNVTVRKSGKSAGNKNGNDSPRNFGESVVSKIGNDSPRNFGESVVSKIGNDSPRNFGKSGDDSPRNFGKSGNNENGNDGPRNFGKSALTIRV